MTSFALLYDFDGCLVNSLPTWHCAILTALQEHGANKDSINPVAACRGIKRYAIELLHISEDEADAIFVRTNQLFNDYSSSISANPGVITTLHKLQQAGVKLAIVTSSPRSLVLPIIDRTGIGRYIHTIVCRDDTTSIKPNPQPLRIACQQLAITSETIFMVGDSDKDIEAAARAGVRSVLYFPPHHTAVYAKEKLLQHQPNYVISSHTDILPILYQ